MKHFIILLTLVLSVLSQAQTTVFDLKTLIEVDAKIQNTFQTISGKYDPDEILNDYVTNKDFQKNADVQELRNNIKDYLRSSYVDRKAFPKNEYETGFFDKNYRTVVKTPRLISKLTIQLMLEQVWYSGLVLTHMTRPDYLRHNNTSDFLLSILSPIFDLEHIGAPGGPGYEWKSVAKVMTTGILILSMIVDADGNNFGIPSFALAVFSSDPFVEINSNPYKIPTEYLFKTSLRTPSPKQSNLQALNKSGELWFDFLRSNYER